MPLPVRGHSGLRAFVSGLITGFPDLRFEVLAQIADGDKVAARWAIHGTHKGTFLGIPPTGVAILDQGVDVFVFRHGKIGEVWVNENDLGLLRQLGVIPGA